MNTVLCVVCEKPITDEEWDDHCEGHEEECPNYGDGNENTVDCDCDLPYHRECCPDCQEEE